MDKRPILSICIPTYNRADVLKLCLDSIVSSTAFCDDVEVIISDNCSTDDTRKVCEAYTDRHPNVKYYCNQNNIGGDRNILHSLELGSGSFLKLNNDYSVFQENGLSSLLKFVKENIDDKPVLYFNQYSNKHTKQFLYSFDELLHLEHWGLSWIGVYGYWKDDFDSWSDRDARIDTMFQQIDWFVRSFKKKQIIVYYCECLTKRHPFKAVQGGYNFIKVHSDNYFLQFEELVDEGLLSQSVLEETKKVLLTRMIDWLIVLRYENKGKFSYEGRDSFQYLKTFYGNYPWFYKVVLQSIILHYWRRGVKMTKDSIKKLIRRNV